MIVDNIFITQTLSRLKKLDNKHSPNVKAE